MIVLGMTKGSESDPSPYKSLFGFSYYPAGFEGPPPSQIQTPLLGQLMNWAPSLEHFDMRYYDWDRDVSIVDSALAPILNAMNPDLSAYKAHGGKLIMYHG